jgi:hypothetical protein
MLSKDDAGVPQPALSPLISAPLLRPLVTHRLVKGKLPRETLSFVSHLLGLK